MKQIIQNLRSGETSLLDVPVPKPGSGMALVRTSASLVSVGTERMLVDFASKSIIGKARSRPDLVLQTINKARREGLLTTLEAIRNRLDQPLLLGYSSAGEITEVGDNLPEFKVGDRVACAGGGYAVHAEYAVIPKQLLSHLPDSVSFEEGAFTTLGAIALHGFRLGEPQVGESVAVIGLGLLGQLTVQIGLAAGCKVFGVDLEASRVELAHQLGAEVALREDAASAADSLTRGKGFDVVLICADTTSNDPVNLAGEIARDRARVVAVGAVGQEIPRGVYFQKELSFRISRSYGPGRYDPTYEEGGKDYPYGFVRWTEGRNLAAIVEMIDKRQLNVEPLITHRFAIEDGIKAYDLITNPGTESPLGVLISYPADDETPNESPGKYVTPRASSKPSKSVRLGVLGAGNFANAVMLPALKSIKNLDLVGVVAATGVEGNHAANRFGFNYASTEEQDLHNDDSINTIAILTRHNLHARQVVAGLGAGKHVFCEKPLAIHEEELEEILRALHDSDGLLMVGFNRRFANLSQKLQRFLAPVRDPLFIQYRVNAGALPTSHWVQDPEQGGGRIVGEGCHFIDFLTFLTDSIPVEVHATGLQDDDRYREDNVLITVQFADGSIGTLSYLSNGDRAFAKERVEVFGGGRVAVLDDFRSLSTFYEGKSRTWRSALKQDKGHKAEWDTFSAAIESGGPAPIPYDQLFSVTMATFAAVESLRTRQRVPVESLHI